MAPALSCVSRLHRNLPPPNSLNYSPSCALLRLAISLARISLPVGRSSYYIQKRGNSTSFKEQPRVNPLGIQYLSHDLHRKVFPKTPLENYLKANDNPLVGLAKDHLDYSGLLGKKTQISEPINIANFPDLVGKSSVNEHFSRIGAKYAEPYLSMAKHLFLQESLPPPPSVWQLLPGWTRYAPGEAPKLVLYPTEDELVFDVEVLYKVSPFAVMATAVSPKAWYGWVNPVLVKAAEGSSQDISDYMHLIPFDTQKSHKLLVGYNVSYDRARILEEYNLKLSKAYFLDIMALHVAISGFCSQQRPLWQKHKKNEKAVTAATEDPELLSSADEDEYLPELSAQDIAQQLMDDPWLNKGAPNSLANAAEFHCGVQVDKAARDFFGSEDLNDIVENFQHLMTYCAKDVDVTFQVGRKLFPQFQTRCPHPVSFTALKLMGKLFLPTSKKWESYVQKAEEVYEDNRKSVSDILVQRVEDLLKVKDSVDYESDPWLRQMNWAIKEPRIRKDGTQSAKQAYLTGYPEWYRDLFKSGKDPKTGQRKMNLTVRSRITPLLLKLKWEGYPLIWTTSNGWCFKVPYEEELIEKMLAKNYTKAKLSEEDMELMLPELRDNGEVYELFKVPHSDGPKKRCTLVMTKSYLRYFESGVLTSEYEYAKNILNLNATASYWMGNRARIKDQFVVYSDPKGEKNQFFKTKKEGEQHPGVGMIIPKLCTMGTVTRRATENTWLTASNSKKNRIGSELKAMVQAPKGYVFVGADVDSEELWIASLIGDSLFKTHGATALGWMTLEGDKNEKTDLHSKTASIMGILRNDAKVFNYGRIYGAGVKFATQLLKQCNASLGDAEAEKTAKELYQQTKGSVNHINKKKYYYGGTESVMFNTLEAIAHEESPRTPVLGAAITDALTLKNLNKNSYLTSRVNWTIQSSGVDYLHLLVVSMEYLMDKFQVDGRLMITVHDEVRYMVKEEQKLLCLLLLQISNVWTRAMFCEQLGLNELPQSCAFFSEVDIDFVLRKEVGLDCITPSHPEPIASGESYDIRKLLGAFDYGESLRDKAGALMKLRDPKVKLGKRIMERLDNDLSEEMKFLKLKMQTSTSRTEWTRNSHAFLKRQLGLNFQPAETQKSTPRSRSYRKRVVEEHNLGAEGDALLKEQIKQDSIKAQPLPLSRKPRKASTTSLSSEAQEKQPPKNGTRDDRSRRPLQPAQANPPQHKGVPLPSTSERIRDGSLKAATTGTKNGAARLFSGATWVNGFGSSPGLFKKRQAFGHDKGRRRNTPAK